MSEKIDFVEKSTTFVSIAKASESEIVIDDQYRKVNKKNEIKFIKLNSDNYQNWTNDMKILLSIKMMWFLIFETISMFDSLKFFDHVKWLIDDVQTKTWIYVNLKNSQHNHIKKLIIAHAMWKTLKKVHDAFDQKKLNFLKKKFFNYKTETTKSIDDVCSNLSRLQMIIRDIKSNEISIDLNIALILINSVNNKTYIMIKYYLKNMKNLTLIYIKKRLKLIKQKIKNNSITDDVTNKSKISNKKRSKKQKNKRECYFCNKQRHYKLKCFKWLVIDEEKKYAEKQTKKISSMRPKRNQSIKKKSNSKRSDKSTENVKTTQKKKWFWWNLNDHWQTCWFISKINHWFKCQQTYDFRWIDFHSQTNNQQHDNDDQRRCSENSWNW